MADVTIKYKDNVISEMDDSGTTVLSTSQTYCEGDITVEYVAKETGLSNVKRWDVTITGIPTSGSAIILVDDPWFAENRTNEKLCVVVLPKFTITANESVSVQGIHLCSNMAFYADSTASYYSMYSRLPVNTDGVYSYTRSNNLLVSSGQNIGDMMVSAGGKLQGIASATYPWAAGEYVVLAFIL
jgi:hypothetical protein